MNVRLRIALLAVTVAVLVGLAWLRFGTPRVPAPHASAPVPTSDGPSDDHGPILLPTPPSAPIASLSGDAEAITHSAEQFGAEDPSDDFEIYGTVGRADGEPICDLHGSVRLSGDDGSVLFADLDPEGSYSQAHLTSQHWSVRGFLVGFRKQAKDVDLEGAARRIRMDFALQKGDVLVVRVVTPDGHDIDAAALKQIAPNLTLSVLATRELPPQRLDYPQDMPYARLSMRELPQSDPPPGGLGRLALDDPLPAWISLVVGGEVLDSQWVKAGVSEVRYVVAPERLDAALGAVRLRPVDVESHDPVFAEVSLRDARGFRFGDPLIEAIPNKSGVVAFDKLVPGPVEIIVDADDDFEAYDAVIVVPSGSTLDLGDMPVQRATTVRGRVIGPQGEPEPVGVDWFPLETAADLMALRTSPVQRRPNVTVGDAQGCFTATKLRRGRYLFRFTSRLVAADVRVVDTTHGDVTDVLVTAGHAVEVLLVPRYSDDEARDVHVTNMQGHPVWAVRRLWGDNRPFLYLPAGMYEVSTLIEARTLSRTPFEVKDQRLVVSLPQ